MSKIENASIVREATVYFDGKVTSRTILLEDGTKKTLGFMMGGDYTFNTELAEVMEVMGGEMEVQLPGSEEWITVTAGNSFDVPANSTFKLIIKTFADYCCSYIAE